MWILMLAMIIACVGLFNNSPATIIGAMLISPLMNGIITMGYSLGVRDLSMLGKAFKRFATQVGISLAAATFFFSIARLDKPTAEMLSRTSPTFWDVLIALFGGVAGMIGNTRQKRSNVIPGVAIATALMPPLCTAGYGLAMWKFDIFIGALYLFLINTLLIAMAAWIVTYALKIPSLEQLNVKRRRRINIIAAIISVCVVVPSILTGIYTMYNANIDNRVEKYIESEFTFEGTQLVQHSVDKDTKIINIALVGKTISGDTIDLLREQLGNYKLSDYKLNVAQNSVWNGEENSDKITIAVQENNIAQLQNQLEEQQIELDELRGSISAKVDFCEVADKAEALWGDYLEKCHCGIISDNNPATGPREYLVLMATYKQEITPEVKSLIQNWLKMETVEDVAILIAYDKPFWQ